MNKKLLLHICLVFCISRITNAQNFQRPEIDLNEYILKLTPFQTEDVDYEDIYENLFTLVQNPINLNKADINQLQSLFILSESETNAILTHRQKFGDFVSIFELQAVEGLSMETIRQLLPFVVVNPTFKTPNIRNLKMRATDSYLVLRMDQTLQKSKAYTENKYLGSPQRVYTRFRMSHSKDFSLGFVSEKDPGETNLLDYFNFHIQVQNKGIIKNAVLGDYLTQFGQGLIFSAGFAAGKGSEPIYTTRRSNLGIKPYNSVVENLNMRGGAVTLKKGNVELTTMVSHNKRDASGLDPDTEDEQTFFSSILSSGFHRTETEIANRKTVSETNVGANVLYRVDHIQLGFSALKTNFDNYFQKRDLPYNNFQFKGTSNFILGPNFSINWQNFNIFGEAAKSSSGGYGYVIGAVAALSSKIEWAINTRNYQKNFHSFYGSAFSEGSQTNNEKGIYTGIKFTPKKGLVLTGFYDQFTFPWLKFGIDAPSSGYDYQLRISRQPNRTFTQYLAFHHEVKQRNDPQNELPYNTLIDTYRNNLVLGTSKTLRGFLTLQNKIQYNGFKIGAKSNGFAVIQDIEAKVNRIQIKTRVAYFNTDDYNSRIYAYENDVLYAVSFPAYYGRGWRFYMVSKLPINNKIDAWIRLSHTNVNERPYIGSGNDQLPGNNKTDVKLQLRYRF
jgi:hypothetical protein